MATVTPREVQERESKRLQRLRAEHGAVMALSLNDSDRSALNELAQGLGYKQGEEKFCIGQAIAHAVEQFEAFPNFKSLEAYDLISDTMRELAKSRQKTTAK